MGQLCRAVLAVLLLAAPLAVAQRATADERFLVTRTDDPTPGECDTDCSLREALIASNNEPGADTIVLPRLPGGVFRLTLDNGPLSVTDTEALTVEGNGQTIEQTQDDTSVLAVTSDLASLTLRDVRISGGDSPQGAGVWNMGSLLVESAAFVGNIASGDGGAISSSGPSLVVRDTLFQQNTAFNGGAIATSGDTVANIARSAFVENHAENDGGALYPNSTELEITDSTVYDNTADGFAGGIGVGFSSGGAYIVRTTVAFNNGDQDTTGSSPGGGIAGGGPAVLTGSIVYWNTTGGAPVACAGDVTSAGYNVLEGACGITMQPSDTGANPMLGTFGSHGGPTPTLDIGIESSAIDRIPADSPACGTTDQRGVPRPQGAGCDSGAYERALCGLRVVNVVGTSGSDVLEGTAGDDGVLALAGNDTVRANRGNDAVCGDSGNDRLYGGSGDDTLDGGSGKKDKCYGEAGTDSFKACETKKQ